MKIKRHKIILYIILGMFFFLNLFMFYNFNKFGGTTAPDFVQNEYFSNIFSKDFKMEVCYKGLNEVANIYGSRGLRITTNGCVSHGSMHGFIVLEGIFKAIDYNLKYLVIPLFNLILLIFTYKITFLLFKNKNTALLSTIMVGTSASILYFSNLFFNNVPAVAMALGFIYFLLKFKETEKLKFLIVGLIFFGISVWIRYPIVIFLFPIALLIFGTKKKIKSLLISIFIGILFAFPLIKTNLDLFGSFTGNGGKSLANSNYYSKNISGTESGFGVDSFLNIKEFLNNYYYHFIELYGILFIFLPILVSRNYKSKNNIIFIIGLVIFINYYFYFIEVWSGTELRNTVSTSYSRYTLLGLILLIIILSNIIIKYRKLGMLILFFWLIGNINLGINGYDSYYKGLENQKRAILKKRNFLKNYPEKNAIIYTSYFDKYFFPDRIAGIYTTFPEKTRLKDTAISIKKLLKKGFPVYMIKSDWATNYDIYKWKDYKKEILKQGILIEGDGSIFKFKLKKTNEQN